MTFLSAISPLFFLFLSIEIFLCFIKTLGQRSSRDCTSAFGSDVTKKLGFRLGLVSHGKAEHLMNYLLQNWTMGSARLKNVSDVLTIL